MAGVQVPMSRSMDTILDLGLSGEAVRRLQPVGHRFYSAAQHTAHPANILDTVLRAVV